MLALVILLAVVVLGCAVALGRQQRRLRAVTRERDRLESEVQSARQHGSSGRRRNAMKAVMESAVESATRLREGGVSGLLMSSIDDLSRWASEDRTEINRFVAPDGTVTIMFSDIEDSTTLNDQLGDKEWVRLLGAHDRLVRTAVEQHRGHIVKSQGDGFMIVFSDPAQAVRAGIEIQDSIASGTSRKLRRTPIRVRVGIHGGTVVEKDGDYFGTNVAMAARVAAQAEGGEILVSDQVRQALRDADDSADIVLVDFRETELKGLPGTHRLWEVALV